MFTDFIKIVQEIFALEPADEHTKNSILNMLHKRYPGDYNVKLSYDHLGNIKINLIFKELTDATYFVLKHG